MRYMRCVWHHDAPGEPVLLYSEINDDGWELRKVEMFANGDAGYSCEGETSLLCVGLSVEPIPPLEEIAKDPVFEPSEITKEEFEKVWTDARAKVREQVSKLVSRIHEQLTNGALNISATLEEANFDTEQVVEWLRGLPIPVRFATVIWIADRKAERMPLDTFFASYDDYWYSSRDDVWILDESFDWLLELDHEEIFRFYTRSTNQGN